jgi:hypothetical protein
MERKLLKLIEKILLLKAYAQAASQRLRSNTCDSAEITDGLKADFYLLHTDIYSVLEIGSKKSNDEKT